MTTIDLHKALVIEDGVGHFIVNVIGDYCAAHGLDPVDFVAPSGGDPQTIDVVLTINGKEVEANSMIRTLYAALDKAAVVLARELIEAGNEGFGVVGGQMHEIEQRIQATVEVYRRRIEEGIARAETEARAAAGERCSAAGGLEAAQFLALRRVQARLLGRASIERIVVEEVSGSGGHDKPN